MTKTFEEMDAATIEELLALENADQVTTQLMLDMGGTFEMFLEFCKIPTKAADRNVKILQAAIREYQQRVADDE
jgi:hypothetical protein